MTQVRMLYNFIHLPLKDPGSSVYSCLKAFCINFVLVGGFGAFFMIQAINSNIKKKYARYSRGQQIMKIDNLKIL